MEPGEPPLLRASGFQKCTTFSAPARLLLGHRRQPQEAEIVSLPFVDRVCPHRRVAEIARELPAEGDVLVHCKVGSWSCFFSLNFEANMGFRSVCALWRLGVLFRVSEVRTCGVVP